MAPRRRVLTYAGLFVLSAVAIGAAASGASSSARSPTVVRPVIGAPTTVPARAMAGKQFTVSFKVTRSDNGQPLTTGTMICDPSSAGKVITHAESFRAGIARLSFMIPTTATQIRVKVTIELGTQSATRITMFRVAQAPKPSVSIGDVSVAEGNAGTTTMSFPVTLSAASTLPVSVGYTTTDGTAVAPGDYTTASGTLAFKPGETTKTIAVSVVGDATVELNETLTVTISNPVNATIADATATGTITNDDVAPPATPGHFAGTIGNAQASLNFDIGADGRSMSNLVTGEIDESCDPNTYTFWFYGFHGSGPFPIAMDGSFTVSGSHTDPQLTWTLKFSGKFSGASASGILHVESSYVLSNGTQLNCTSGDQPWTASKV